MTFGYIKRPKIHQLSPEKAKTSKKSDRFSQFYIFICVLWPVDQWECSIFVALNL